MLSWAGQVLLVPLNRWCLTRTKPRHAARSGRALLGCGIGANNESQRDSIPMSKTVKKRYLKALNWRLKKESAGKLDTVFVCDPPGAKPKDATGVTVSGPTNDQILAAMSAVQARVLAEFERTTKTR